MSIQLLQLDDYMLKAILKYFNLVELIRVSSACKRFGDIALGKLKERKMITRADFNEMGFCSSVISSEIFRGRKFSANPVSAHHKLSSLFNFLLKLPCLEDLYLDILLSLVPRNELRTTAVRLASCCPLIVKFTGIEDGEQFILEYYEAIEELGTTTEISKNHHTSAIVFQINPRDYFWDVHHESIRRLVSLRREFITLSISCKYIGRKSLDWIMPTMISKLNVDMSTDELRLDKEILSHIKCLIIDWNWARDRPVTPIKLNHFVTLLTNAREINVLKAYDVPDSPQLLQQLSCLQSKNLFSVELHILNQGVDAKDREAIHSFLGNYGNQLRSFTLRCDYIKERANHGMDTLFRCSILKRCPRLTCLELSYYISYRAGVLTIERYQEDSLLGLLSLFPKTRKFEILFPTDGQAYRWIDEFKWFSSHNKRIHFSLNIWRCSKYAICKKSFEEHGPNWSIVEISPDLSELETFTFVQ